MKDKCKLFLGMLGILGVVFLFMITACTDAQRSKLYSYGGKADVECYSGTKLIYKGTSTGKISSSENSDGYYFRDAESGKLIEVCGNCVLTYIEE